MTTGWRDREIARIVAMTPAEHQQAAAELLVDANGSPSITNTLLYALVHAQLATAKHGSRA